MLNHNQILRKINQSAQHLCQLEFIYSEVAKRMMERLDYIKLNPALILDIGSGLNIDANLLAKKFPNVPVYKLDLAINVLKLSRYKPNFWQRIIRTYLAKNYSYSICGDALRLPVAANSMDVVWSNLTLPYIDDLEKYFKEIRRVLNLGGCFLISGLGVDSLHELRQVGLRTYNFPDMHEIGDILVKLGFTNPVMDMEYITLEYEDFKLLLQDVRILGIGAAALTECLESAKPSLQTKRGNLCSNSYLGRHEYTNLAEKFAKMTKDGKVPLTLEVFYAHAWKDKVHLDLPKNQHAVQFYPGKSIKK